MRARVAEEQLSRSQSQLQSELFPDLDDADEPVQVSDTAEGHAAFSYIQHLFASAIAETPLGSVVLEQENAEGSGDFAPAYMAATMATEYCDALFQDAITKAMAAAPEGAGTNSTQYAGQPLDPGSTGGVFIPAPPAPLAAEKTRAQGPGETLKKVEDEKEAPTLAGGEPQEEVKAKEEQLLQPEEPDQPGEQKKQEEEQEEQEQEQEEEDAEDECDTDEEEEDDDGFDANFEMAPMPTRARGGGSDRRMSLADIQSSSDDAAMASLRQQLTSDEVDEYRDFFDMVDADNSNALDAAELNQAMQLMGMETTEEQIKAMIGEVHVDSANPVPMSRSLDSEAPQELEMNFDEFLTLMAIYVGPRGETRDKELREAFEAIDADRSGEIDTEELTEAFNNYGSKFSDAEIQQIMSAVDTDGSGEIDFDEFKVMMSIAENEDEAGKALKKKARTTVRALIMQSRMKDAFASFDAR